MSTILTILEYSKKIRSTNDRKIKFDYINQIMTEINLLLQDCTFDKIIHDLYGYINSYKEDFNLIYSIFIDMFILKKTVYFYNSDMPLLKYFCTFRNNKLIEFENKTLPYAFHIRRSQIAQFRNYFFHSYQSNLFDLIYKEAIPLADFLINNQLFNHKIYINIDKIKFLNYTNDDYYYTNRLYIMLKENDGKNLLNKEEIVDKLKADYFSVFRGVI